MNTCMVWILPTYFCLLLIGGYSIRVLSASNEEAKLVFYYGSHSFKETYELRDAVEILNHPQFDFNRKTVFYVHGFIQTLMSPTLVKFVEAYRKRGTHNVIILDWSALAGGLYPAAVYKSLQLGPAIADVFLRLFDNGLPHWDLHIVGHSLGAHLAGQIGRTIIDKSDGFITLQRITGLDPANLLFYPPLAIIKAVSDRDAILVDIIHTDKRLYGTTYSTGTVDFWPNAGQRVQPGCLDGIFFPFTDRDLCSHKRSVWLWAESVENPSSTFFAVNRKFRSTRIQMGIDCAIDSPPGDYDLSTRTDYPYSIDNWKQKHRWFSCW